MSTSFFNASIFLGWAAFAGSNWAVASLRAARHLEGLSKPLGRHPVDLSYRLLRYPHGSFFEPDRSYNQTRQIVITSSQLTVFGFCMVKMLSISRILEVDWSSMLTSKIFSTCSRLNSTPIQQWRIDLRVSTNPDIILKTQHAELLAGLENRFIVHDDVFVNRLWSLVETVIGGA